MDTHSKKCSKCETMKPFESFHAQPTFTASQRSKPSGWKKVCKACSNEIQRLKAHELTESCFRELWVKQGGKCALCQRDFLDRRPAIDHNHATGKVRGLLCLNCNVGLGHLKDNPALLMDAAAYLIKHY